MIFAVAAAALLLGLALIALLERSGRTATGADGTAAEPWMTSVGRDGFARLLPLLFAEMGFEVERLQGEGELVDLLIVNRAPISGIRAYVRGIWAPASPVGEDEVRGAIDTARAESAGKAIVVTSGRFSEAAGAAMAGVSAELVDGAALAALVRKYLPQVAASGRV